MWLRDSLAKDLTHARIFVYGYDTKLENSDSFQTITDLGIQLRISINNIRNDRTVGHMNAQRNTSADLKQDNSVQRPLVFLGHSLGGLIIKQVSTNPGFLLYLDTNGFKGLDRHERW